MVEDLADVAHVGLDDGDVLVGLQQRAAVHEHHRIAVDVDDARRGVDLVGDLVHVVLGRQTRAEVDDLGDPGFLDQPAHHAQERDAPALGELLRLRFHREDGVADPAVDGEVLLAAEDEVVHPGDRGPRGVDLGQRAGAEASRAGLLVAHGPSSGALHRASCEFTGIVNGADAPTSVRRPPTRVQPSHSAAGARSNARRPAERSVPVGGRGWTVPKSPGQCRGQGPGGDTVPRSASTSSWSREEPRRFVQDVASAAIPASSR